MKVPARVWNDVLTQLLTVDLRGDLRAIKARTLILWGDKDGVCDPGRSGRRCSRRFRTRR